jgi:hypothetical protein
VGDEAKTPDHVALFLLFRRGFASLARMDAASAWGRGGNHVLKTGGDNPWPE